ncbi:sporulation histidine kinase inhibitor Sda [Halalkalibacterium ligniniphilum]|nr:sporulation histidine kinase inhibitor Sda [Halalkalibacterium ligniniphilum]
MNTLVKLSDEELQTAYTMAVQLKLDDSFVEFLENEIIERENK